MALFGAILFDPGSVTFFSAPWAYYHSPLVNAALLALALWVLAVLEDRELASHFGAEYEAYAARVRRLFPN
jgi:protein-S-isoprenylcysteine O-methyltransferase Ste14